ncbi:MAG: urease accessory protein UreE [Hyphomicrobiaceae bacterium]|nr:MAG: urease accessory protein UreE [Hyphomicrobiaceae bacterium]
MIRSTRVLRAGASGEARPSDTITLDREGRHRRRIAMTSDGGRSFLLDLAQATYLGPGDMLALDDGTLIEVKSADEDLLKVEAADAPSLARLAWHVGNRHTPAEITTDALYIKPDHVLADMLRGLGAKVTAERRPFEPEGGAYGGKGALHHGHHHGHDHGQSHDHKHGHDHHHGQAASQHNVFRPRASKD